MKFRETEDLALLCLKLVCIVMIAALNALRPPNGEIWVDEVGKKKQLMNEMIIQKMVGGIKLAFYVLLSWVYLI